MDATVKHAPRSDFNFATLTPEAGVFLAWFARLMCWLMPTAFILAKTLDVYLYRTEQRPWYLFLAEGIFRKADDVSLVVALAGLATACYVAAAGLHLAKFSDQSGKWTVTTSHAALYLALVIFSWAAYLAGMYFSDGTFFHGEGNWSQRLGQVIEGTLNLGLIAIGHFYGILGLCALGTLRPLMKSITRPPIPTELLLAAEALWNVSLALIVGAIALACIFPFFDSIMLWLDKHFWYGFLASKQIISLNPLGDLHKHLGTLVVLLLVCFVLYFWFAIAIQTALPKWLRPRFNPKFSFEPIADASTPKPLVKVGPFSVVLREKRLVLFVLVQLKEHRPSVAPPEETAIGGA